MSAANMALAARAGRLTAAAQARGASLGGVGMDSIAAFSAKSRRPNAVRGRVAMLAFLLSNEASNLTGGAFAIDGGWSQYRAQGALAT